MDKYDSLKIKNQLCFPLYLTAKEMTGIYNRKLKDLDLTYTQYIVMMYFWEKGSSNLKELSKTLMLDSSTLTPIVKKLEAKGFIQKQRSEKDERNLLLTLTKKGEQLKEEALDIPFEVGRCVDVTNEEMKQLRAITAKILMNIRNSAP